MSTPDSNNSGVRHRLVTEALAIMKRDGVLAGVNLQEVADRAGVTRTNIYHYFGSRQAMLREALYTKSTPAGARWVEWATKVPFLERYLGTFDRDGMADTAEKMAVIVLLALDGDTDLDPNAFLEDSVSALRQDVINDEVDRRHDLVAFHIATHAFRHGYRALRTAYARRLGVDPSELDARIRAAFQVWLEAVQPDQPSPG